MRFWFDLRRRRLPDRRRPRAGQGRGPARRRLDRRGRRSSAERGRPPALGPRRGPRDLPGAGARSPTPTTIRACSSPRPGCTAPSGWRATSAPTSCTPRSTSTSCWRRGRPSRLRDVDRSTRSSAHEAVGAPPTWVLSNHDTVREVSRYARPQGDRRLRQLDDLLDAAGRLRARRAAGARRRAADARAARRRLRLPGRGARPRRGRGPARRGARRTRAGSSPVDTNRGRDGCRVPIPWSGDEPPFGFSPDGASAPPWLPQPASWRALTVAVADRRRAARCSSSTAGAAHPPRASGARRRGAALARRARRCARVSPATPGSSAWSTCRPSRAPGRDGAELLLSSGEARGRRRRPGRYDRVVYDA